jgi:hypothetical protein
MQDLTIQEKELLCPEKIHPLAYLALFFHPIPLFIIMVIIILYT